MSNTAKRTIDGPGPIKPSEKSSPRLQIAPNLQSRFAEHAREWKGTTVITDLPGVYHNRPPGEQLKACQRCPLCQTRRNVCLYRGSLPCDVLFIGEAPGESEDALGFPFVGAAGKELDGLVFSAYGSLEPEHCIQLRNGVVGNARGHLTYGVTNILGCIPRTPEEMATGDIRPPHKEEAAACQPRLLEIIKMANPRAIVFLGKVAARFFPKVPIQGGQRWEGHTRQLDHPSAILRAEIPSHQSLMRKKFVIALSKLLKELT